MQLSASSNAMLRLTGLPLHRLQNPPIDVTFAQFLNLKELMGMDAISIRQLGRFVMFRF